MSKQVGCTPTSFLLLSILSSSASVAWQSLLLALTSTDGHLHSSLISLVDVRLSPFLSSPHNPHHHILFHHSAKSMAHAHVLREGWKSLRLFKYETISWLVIGGIEVGNIFCVRKMKHNLTIWFCRDELPLAMLFWDDIIVWLVCLKYYYFLCQYELLFWIIWI